MKGMNPASREFMIVGHTGAVENTLSMGRLGRAY